MSVRATLPTRSPRRATLPARRQDTSTLSPTCQNQKSNSDHFHQAPGRVAPWRRTSKEFRPQGQARPVPRYPGSRRLLVHSHGGGESSSRHWRGWQRGQQRRGHRRPLSRRSFLHNATRAKRLLLVTGRPRFLLAWPKVAMCREEAYIEYCFLIARFGRGAGAPASGFHKFAC
jgi:hypothetical protein